MIEQIRSLIAEASADFSCGWYLKARQGYVRAALQAREADAADLRAAALEGLAKVDGRAGRSQDALESLEESAALYDQIGDRRRAAIVTREMAVLLSRLERWLDARVAWRRARSAFAEAGTKADLNECDDRLHEIGARIEAEVRAERRRAEAADPAAARRRLFGREWLR